MAYLDDNPPKRPQSRARNRAFGGVIVVHTGETKAGTRGAENLANFIRHRDDAGCYHDISDQNSVVEMVEYELASYHCRGYNGPTLGLGIAAHAADWPNMGEEIRRGTLTMAALSASKMIRWAAARGVVIPLRKINKRSVDAGYAGFTSHADLDPGRRTDPGDAFPWSEFFELVKAHLDGTIQAVRNDETMSPFTEPNANTRSVQENINKLSTELGLPQIKEDGYIGTKTSSAIIANVIELQNLKRRVAALDKRDDSAEAQIGRELIALVNKINA